MPGNHTKNRSTTYWIRARKTVQALSFLFIVGAVILAQRNRLAGDVINLPLRLDPLVALADLLSSRAFLAGSSLALVTILLSVVFGRAWCGWLCPLGTLLDLIPLKRRKTPKNEPPQSWRSIKYSLLFVILFAALFGNLALLFLDPLTIFTRTITISILPGIDQLVSMLERSLYPLPGLAEVISSFDGWIRPSLLPVEPVNYRFALLYLALLVGIVSLNRVAPRFWCRYVCPLGALLGLIAKFSLFRQTTGNDCKGCALCEKACPTGTIDPQKGYNSDPSECIMCLDCLQACPRSSIAFTKITKPGAWNNYDPGRHQALVSFSAVVAAIAVLRSSSYSQRQHPHLLLPPGAEMDEFLSRCVRCALCVRACPTGALQPSLSEAGVDGFWAPVLVPRLGYCDYACNACGQVCPTQAIPPLPLEDKRLQVIGKAYIDRDRCIAWSDGQPCIVCEEMCPVPEKAIALEPSQTQLADGTLVDILLPQVLRERCIGCGICENRCPVNGSAAIRVFVAN
jgi:polyferredoxin